MSVCIPVYEPGADLIEAIESVLAQRWTDFELWIVDDASTIAPDVIVEAFDDPRIRYARNARNLGLAGNWNRCLELASGALISIFHQDDVMLPGFLEGTVAAMEGNPDAGFVYTNILRIDKQGRPMGEHHIAQPTRDRLITGDELYAMVARTGNPIACPSVVARASCYDAHGGFDTRFDFAADQEMWMRLARHHPLLYVAEPLIEHRVHAGQQTSRFAGSGRDYQEVLRALDQSFGAGMPVRLARYAGPSYATLAKHASAMARWKLRSGMPLAALRYLAVWVAARWRVRHAQVQA